MKIAIIGCGNMGMTYAKAFLNNGLITSKDLLLVERYADQVPELSMSGIVSKEVDDQIKTCDVIILSVKPQDSKEMFSTLKSYLSADKLVISIMAGVNLTTLTQELNHNNIVRAMPNTPAQIGKGITGYTALENVSNQFLDKAAQLLQVTGKIVLMQNEDQIDAVTALSGSGPAYFYYIVDQMIKAGVEMGIDEETATLLIKETMNGSYHLMQNSSKSLDELIKAVTSKGGTTEAALNTFKDAKVGENIQKGLFAAKNRAKELSK